MSDWMLDEMSDSCDGAGEEDPSDINSLFFEMRLTYKFSSLVSLA